MAENEKSAEAEVREKLAHLQALKTKLDASDGEISQVHLPAVETMLSSLRLGVPISLQMGGEDANGVTKHLRFEKRASKAWRLCVVEALYDGETYKEESTPLSDVPRDDRAFIFELFIPVILDAALHEMEERVNRRQKAIDAARNLVESVGKINHESRGAADRSTVHLKDAFEAEYMRREAGLAGDVKTPEQGPKNVEAAAILESPLFKAVIGLGEAATKAAAATAKSKPQRNR